MVRSPWSDKKVSGRAGHNYVALTTAINVVLSFLMESQQEVTFKRPYFNWHNSEPVLEALRNGTA